MSKRIIAAFMVALFVLGAALAAAPTWAHTTLGMQTDTNPYRYHDSDTNGGHVPGPTGYVWPGSGKDWYTGDMTEPPGYQSPWGNYPAGAPTSWYQLRGNTYAPFGAILASTDEYENVGDLIFGINFTKQGIQQLEEAYNYTSWIIYIPPEFGVIGEAGWPESGVLVNPNNVVTTAPVPLGGPIRVMKADVKDPFGPGWWIVYIPAANISFTSGHSYKEWYYVRINGVVAPKICGRYFFKMFLNDSFPLLLSDPNGDGTCENIITSTMPVENWPVLLVKGEIDPGIIEGEIFYNAPWTDLLGKPLELPGRVRAVGEVYNPYTMEPIGRKVEVRGYFNASAKGHFELEGVPPGMYDIYASAAGYPETEEPLATGILVYPGKSVHLKLYLDPGAVVHGTVYAKHAFGTVNWNKELPVTVEIYDSNEWPAPTSVPGGVWGDVDGTVPDNWLEWERGTLTWTDRGFVWTGHLKSFSPINLTDAPYTSYVNGPGVKFDATGVELDAAAGVTARSVAFPWVTTTSTYESEVPADMVHNGVGPSQTWWTDPSSSSFDFRFGNKYVDADDDGLIEGLYGAPTEFDGHVPQVFATWVNGLTAGRTYYLRVWINGFVQTDASGNYVDYMITVAGQEWAGDIYVPIDVQLSGWINKTVHFIDNEPVGGPDDYRYLIAEVRDAQGTLVGFNFTEVSASDTAVAIPINGFGMAGPVNNLIWEGQAWPWHPLAIDFNSKIKGMKFFLYRYRHIRDYGLMPGTYKVYVYMRGFVQQEPWFVEASVSLSGRPTHVSNWMNRGAGINVTVYSIDWQHPRIQRNWQEPGEEIAIFVKTISVNGYGEGTVLGDIRYWDGNYWVRPKQTAGFNMVPYDGWTGESKLKFNGSVILERAGPDETVGQYTPDDNDERASVWSTVMHCGVGFLACPGVYRDSEFRTLLGLETGTYGFNVYTLHYVFKDPDKYTVYVAKGQQADTKLNLVIGVNFTIQVLFKKEGLPSIPEYNGTLYVSIWDEDGNFVADGAASFGSLMASPTVIIRTSGYQVDAADTYFTGVKGSTVTPNPDQYTGRWTVKVDAWYTYRDEEYYPPVPGLLMGFLTSSFDRPWNHLGPYELRIDGTDLIPNAPYGGEASVTFEVDLRGFIAGQIAGFSWCDELRTLSWADVTAVGAEVTETVYTLDGKYEMFLPSGTYTLTIEEWPGGAGHTTQQVELTVADGASVGYNFLNMERSGIPIPEFPIALLPTMAALGASLYLLRRRR